MLIPIRGAEGGATKWSLLELQGTVSARDEGPIAGLPLGRFEVVNGKPLLFIGSHKVVGKFVQLGKPLTVLQRCAAPAGDGEGSTSYQVVATVTEKCVFSSRPHPVVKRVGLTSIK